MQIIWTARAIEQLAGAFTFVSTENAPAAERQLRVILRAVNQLADFPEIGRYGRVKGTRELVVQTTPYVVAYRIRLDKIRILSLLHGARRWPSRFEES